MIDAIRAHAAQHADHDKNGWDHISEFMSDDDIQDHLNDLDNPTLAEAIAHFEKIAAGFIDWIHPTA